MAAAAAAAAGAAARAGPGYLVVTACEASGRSRDGEYVWGAEGDKFEAHIKGVCAARGGGEGEESVVFSYLYLYKNKTSNKQSHPLGGPI
jgi:hypothetical protein